MDRKERISDLRETLIATLQGWQADMWSAMPGIIQSVDFALQTCVVQVSVQVSVKDIETGQSQWQSISPLLDCPLFFPHGGSMSITLPVAAGDECLVVFASRCIDGWWQNGDVQPQALFRMHDLSDGFVFAGFRSNSKVVGAISSTKLQIRSADSANLIEIDPVGGQVNVKASEFATTNAPTIILTGQVLIQGGLTVTANASVGGALVVDTSTTTTSLTVGTRDFGTHEHTGGTISGHTGPPI